jgi:hypothetical protein
MLFWFLHFDPNFEKMKPEKHRKSEAAVEVSLLFR